MINSATIEPWALTDQIVAQLTASVGPLPEERRALIARDVACAAKHAFRIPLRLRPATVLSRLKELRTKLQRGELLADISDDLWPALGVGDEPEEMLLASSERLAEAIASAIPEFESMPETLKDRRGGRRRDPRLDNFAYRLAMIYRQHLQEPPTFTQDTETGWLVSPFGQFGYEAFWLFCPIQPLGEGQIREALRNGI
jgi:hypothetical protein